jgi:eukaryotic-like serine/threonine-protein kinase
MSNTDGFQAGPMAEPTDESGTGPLLKNRYKLGRVLGRGGMCIVYQAWDTRLNRDVAIKRLEPPLNQDPRTRARFDREGRALARLSHPNVVTLIDRGSTETDDYLVFEYVEGRSLKELIKEKPLEVDEVGRIVGQVAEGLAAAHQAGIVHRDVKPQNILIDRNGHAKITDFGIATGPDWTRVTKAGSIIGSARYMSPEQVRSKPVDARSDIYSLGVVMYEMLAEHPPFDGANMPEIARQHLNSLPPPLAGVRSDLPPGLEKIVMRCLEKLPEDRFVSMDELLGALLGVGLYALHRTDVEGKQRHTAEEERRMRYSPGGASYDSGARHGDDTGEMPAWQRDRLRQRARKARARRRWMIGGAIGAAVIIAIIVVVLVLTLGGGKAPNVVGLTIEQATQEATSAGLTVQVTAEIPSFDKPAGTVLEQAPDAGIKSDDGILRLTVSREPTPVKVTDIKAYDPSPGDGKENDGQLPNLIDGKESTTWSTELYKSAAFGNLKEGVGFDFTLEGPATIVEVVSTVDGWNGEIRQDTSSGSEASIATLNGTASQIITLREPISSGRFWFTKLTEITTGRYGAELSEIRFYR